MRRHVSYTEPVAQYTFWCIEVYHASVGRTNVVVDDALVERVMRLYRLPTKRAAIDLALRALAGTRERREMLDLRGSGWEGDLPRMRADRIK